MGCCNDYFGIKFIETATFCIGVWTLMAILFVIFKLCQLSYWNPDPEQAWFIENLDITESSKETAI